MYGIACLHAHTHAYTYKYKVDTHTEKISLLQICNRPTSHYLKHCHEFVWKIQHGGVSRDKYSMKQSQVLYLFQGMSLSTVFFVRMSTASALGGILYFELFLSQCRS